MAIILNANKTLLVCRRSRHVHGRGDHVRALLLLHALQLHNLRAVERWVSEKVRALSA